jgi:hypothetical protein
MPRIKARQRKTLTRIPWPPPPRAASVLSATDGELHQAFRNAVSLSLYTPFPPLRVCAVCEFGLNLFVCLCRRRRRQRSRSAALLFFMLIEH